MVFVTLNYLYSCKGGGGDNAVDEFLDVGNDQNDQQDNQDDGPNVGNSALTFSPSTLDFGDIALSSTDQQTVTLTNASEVTVYLSEFVGESSIFSIASNSCPTGGNAFAPGATCNIDFLFSALTGGLHEATINVTYGVTSGAEDLIAYIEMQGSAGVNPPTGYSLTNVTGTTATISWNDNSQNEVSFEVSRCDGVSCATTFVAAFTDFVAPNTTTYQFTGLTEGAYYRYRVRAVTNVTTSDWLVGTTMITFGGVASVDDNGTGTSDLTGLDCRTITEGAYATISWNAVSDATAYFIYDASGGTNTLLTTVNAPATSTTLTGLTINTAYKLLITVATNKGYNSENSATADITTTDYLPCIVLGKTTPNDTTSTHGLYNPSGVMAYNGKLFVADRYNNRILIWNTYPTSNSDAPDVVIGQSGFGERYLNNTPGNIGTASAQSLREPMDVWAGSVGGTDKMVVADYANNRVLIWNSIPTANYTAADVVIGQGNFSVVNADGGDVTKGLQGPIGVWSDGTKLYIADYSNNRVVIHNTFPTSNFATPDVYLGQSSSTGQTGSCAADGMKTPTGVWSDGSTLIVSQNGCHRATVWYTVPATGNPAALTAIGQTNLTNSSAGTGAVNLKNPYKPRMAGGKLFIADYTNNRVKVWNSLPAAGNHGVASDYVIGRSNTTNGNGLTQSRLQNPQSVAIDGTKVFVADYNNYRILGFNTIPLADDSNADFVIGQNSFTTEVVNDHNDISGTTFDAPEGMAWDGNQFFIADPERNRVLVYDGIPNSWNQNPDYVIGQGNFSLTTAARNQAQVNSPRGICVAGGQLWVPDYNNRRIMVFDLPITSNSPNAQAVLGQTTWTANSSGTGKDRVNQAIACYYDGTKFYVVDRTYDRILIYNSLPTMAGVGDNPAADVIVGTNTGNQTSQNQLYDPWGVYSDGTRLFVGDYNNHRVMVWDPIPVADDANASFYLGGNTNWTSRNSLVSSVGLSGPMGITGVGTKIYVMDRNNGRVMVFDNPTTTNEAASEIYGKTDYLDTLEPADNSVLISSDARTLLKINNRLFLGDYNHSRVIAFPVTP
ncbi:MAG: fibronectin type III domain-containing protein [Halobacteriovoraceae bacterium]|nr:fibronectin type III domain-containing protein [Halobacteriovoraceae bacterium]